jgi:hypothetical protein
VGDRESGWQPLREPARAHGTDRPDRGLSAARLVDLGASPFSRLALTHVLSMAGDALLTVALAGSLFFNISPTAARGRVALGLILTITPFAVVAPFLGPIIDRTRGGRRLMVLVSAIGRAAACLAMARVVNSLLLFPAAFTALVFSKSYVVAKASLVPTVVKSQDELVQANSRLALGGAVIGFAVSLPGIGIMKLISASALLNVAAFVYFGAALASMRIVARRPAEGLPAEELEDERAGSGPAVWGPAVAIGGLAMATLRGLVGFTTFLIAFSFRRAHVSTIWFGVVLIFSVLGGLAGTAAAPYLRDRVKEEHMVVGALAGVAVLGLVLSRVGGPLAAAALAGGVGFATSGAKQAFDSLVQRDVPRAHQARAFARFEATFQLVWVLGALIPVVIPIHQTLGFVLIACGAAAAGVIHLVSRRQKSRRPIRWPAVDDTGDGPPGGAPFPSPPPPPKGSFPAVVPPPLGGPLPPT